MKEPGLSYRDAGVDIDAGNALVDRIGPAVARTRRPEVLAGLGGFGGLFALPPGRFREPVLVSGADGVGTKLALAQRLDRHGTIGIDLVAMCVNDIVVCGAEPLFFLDYFATGRLDGDTAATVITGIAAGCERAGCALLGGETAEMPAMYEPGVYDLAGFAVGAVERADLLDGAGTQPGDVLLGWASSGLHSNGFSLVRAVLDRARPDLDAPFEGRETLADVLLTPTRIYVPSALDLIATVRPRALAHITGGGLLENVVRVLPGGLGITLRPDGWPRPRIFTWLQEHGAIAPEEMLRTFNCGIGMVSVHSPETVAAARRQLGEHGIASWPVGEVGTHGRGPRVRLA